VACRPGWPDPGAAGQPEAGPGRGHRRGREVGTVFRLRSQVMPCLRICHRDTHSHGNTHSSTALLPEMVATLTAGGLRPTFELFRTTRNPGASSWCALQQSVISLHDFI
jgi:hypothetical protein